MSTLTIIGLLIIISLVISGIVKLLNFYGIPTASYAVYLTFYVFLLLSYFILPGISGPSD